MKPFVLLLSLLALQLSAIPFTDGKLTSTMDPARPEDGGWNLRLLGPDLNVIAWSGHGAPFFIRYGDPFGSYVGAAPFSVPGGGGPGQQGTATLGSIVTDHFYFSLSRDGQIWTGTLQLYQDPQMTVLLQSVALEGWMVSETLEQTPAIWTRTVSFGENLVPEPTTLVVVSAGLAGIAMLRRYRQVLGH